MLSVSTILTICMFFSVNFEQIMLQACLSFCFSSPNKRLIFSSPSCENFKNTTSRTAQVTTRTVLKIICGNINFKGERKPKQTLINFLLVYLKVHQASRSFSEKLAEGVFTKYFLIS